MAKGREDLNLADLRKVRPVGRALADWLHDVGAVDVAWFKNKHGHLRFTLDGRQFESTFATSPRSPDEACKRAVIHLKKICGRW